MVQKSIFVELPAEDLKLGHLFSHWAVMKDGLYPYGRRILNIKKPKNGIGQITVTTDEETFQLFPEHIVVIQEVV